MQVFGEQPGEFRAATAGFGPSGDREGWEAFLREADAILAEHGVPFCHWAGYERAKLDMYASPLRRPRRRRRPRAPKPL